MRFASVTTIERDPEQAVRALVSQTLDQMDGLPVDLALVFLSPHFKQDSPQISEGLRAALNPRVLTGCTAEGVIGRDHEIEEQPAISLVAAHLPGVDLVPFTLHGIDWNNMLRQEENFKELVGAPEDARLAILLAEPLTTPIDGTLRAFNAFYEGLPVIGGMVSGSQRRGENALLLNDRITTDGAVGVILAGDVAVDVIVSQGCRPIGKPFKVTAAHRNMILSLEGQPPLSQFQRMVVDLSEEDRELIQRNGLFVGLAIDRHQTALSRGDFLIRSVIGTDQSTGMIAVGSLISPGETIQFHVRDAITATEDLDLMLATQELFEPARGAFLFSCNGRGTSLYNHPDGDIATIQEALGGVDIAGFFCAGEIGPIGGKNFLHGHTASLVLFRTPDEALQLRES
jgi:small ligand-binding sensory domain FIST